jgi:UDP-GlcNAc:undecaprenyl-phosphate GlcNAc-1-phosphate transferase
LLLTSLVAVLVAGVVVLGLTPLVRELAFRKGWVDLPDLERKRHARVVPRLGGVALAGGLAAGGLLLVIAGAKPTSDLWALFGGAAVLWAVGLWDDLYGLGFKRKFAVQVLAAYGLLLTGWRLDFSPLPFAAYLDLYDQALLAVPLAVVWMVGIVNAVNLVDGKDGLAAGVAMIAFVALGILALHQSQRELAGFCLVAAAALGAFLAYNWNPASIFMGDSGSLLLGFLLGGVALRVADAATTLYGMLAPAVVLGFPILDTLSCMVRRLLAGRSPFAPDDDHVHDRMVQAAGGSVRVGVFVLYLVAAAYGALGVLAGGEGGPVAVAGLFAAVFLSYLLLRHLSYVRTRVVIRHVRWRWRQHRRAVQSGARPPLRRSLLVAPRSVRLTRSADGRHVLHDEAPRAAPHGPGEARRDEPEPPVLVS